ncbi:MAG: hypothetical protein COB37_10095 [Kordiimonadales bacterium]|nr:MAG: hypothetical protein COB37_10095 [Kordiimonadales bacterium]
MRFTAVLILTMFFSATGFSAEPEPELNNSTLIAKLHFDRSARKGQMVGALQIRIRNASTKPLTSLSLLLNPGLQFVRVEGSGRKQLEVTSDIKAIEGSNLLELNAATVQFTNPLAPSKQREIVIHFRGYIEDLSWTGLDGIKETLHPDFAMIRAQSFAYPIFATPDMASIQRAWNSKPYQQIVFLEMPGGNTVRGSLAVAEKTIAGSKTNYELKSARLTKPAVVAIGNYADLTDGMISVSRLNATEAEARAVLDAANAYSGKVRGLIGAPGKTGSISIIEVPDGYRDMVTTGAIFRGPSFFANPEISADIQAEIFELWRLNTRNQAGHWSTGFDTLTKEFLSNGGTMQGYNDAAFLAAQPLFALNKNLGKAALADYAVDGYTGQSDTVSTLAFAVLYNVLGDEAFFALLRNLRSELANNYADMEAVAEFLSGAVKHKKARKFVKNWFAKGRAGKDMAKAKSFDALVTLYK